jgi:hypothetical protein
MEHSPRMKNLSAAATVVILLLVIMSAGIIPTHMYLHKLCIAHLDAICK